MVNVEEILVASRMLKDVVRETKLEQNNNLSKQFEAKILLKREDQQDIRSYKIRGAYNKISTLDQNQLDRGVICASAGNHAQGVASSCHKLKVKGVIFMPQTTPSQKVRQVRRFGGEFIETHLEGDTFDDAYSAAIKDAKESGKLFIHPFNDLKVIQGQGTVGVEILNDIQEESRDREIEYIREINRLKKKVENYERSF